MEEGDVTHRTLPSDPHPWTRGPVDPWTRPTRARAARHNGPVSDATAAPALDPEVAALLKRDPAGLVAAVVQQHDTGDVLMVGWMNDEALARTLTEGRVTFWSRSRDELWRKGDTSGHVQWVRSVAVDCDGDALLVRVDQVGAACHTGDRTCFDARPLVTTVLDDAQRQAAPADA